MKRIVLIICFFLLNGVVTQAQKASNMPTGKKFYIQSAMNYGKNNGGYWDIPGVYQPNRAINRGANIQVWNLDPHHDRQYTLVQSSINGYYEIQIGYTRSSRVDIDNGRADNGTNVKVWERNGRDAQKFKFHHLGNGRFKIYDRNGKILCLKGRKNSNGTNVHIWNDHNGASVEWYLIDVKTKKALYPSQSKQKITEVKIGEQVWMGENLNVSYFRNGDPIPHARTKKEWVKAAKEKKPAWCYLNNDPANGKKYGKLYNWFAVNDPRGLAPKGWHVPSEEEWSQLVEFVGGKNEADDKLKAKSGWAPYEIRFNNDRIVKKDGNGDDTYGFSALPGGYRWDNGPFDKVKNGYWWTSTCNGGNGVIAHGVSIYYNSDFIVEGFLDKDNGYSVRCLKD